MSVLWFVISPVNRIGVPFQGEKPKTLVLCTIAENKQLFLDTITDKNARSKRMLTKILIGTIVKFFLLMTYLTIYSEYLSHSSHHHQYCFLKFLILPCLQIRACWGESKCSGDIEVLAEQLQQLLGQVEQGQHLLVHHLQPHLDPPDILRLRGLASLLSAFVPLCCSKGSPSRSFPLNTPSYVLLN